jgi:hypothetical protein
MISGIDAIPQRHQDKELKNEKKDPQKVIHIFETSQEKSDTQYKKAH